MTRKKQILYPIVILLIGVLAFIAFKSMKKPPAEKEAVDNTPIVSIEKVIVEPMLMRISSYGVVAPKYETELIAQVSGAIVELSDEFVRGGFVRKGHVLAQIDDSDYQAAFIDAKANLATATAALELEKAAVKVAEDEWTRIKNSSPSELSLRRPQLAQEIAKLKAAEAAIKRAERNLERTQIIAPYDALIEGRNIGLGSYVGTGSALGKLLSISVAEVRLPIANQQLQFLDDQGRGAVVDLTTKYAGDDRHWAAKIVRNEGVIDANSRMTYLVAEIKDPYNLNSNDKEPLPFGAYVNAMVSGVEIANATSVPRYLVNDGQVAVMDANNTLQYKRVEIARRDGKHVIISAGLESGDQVITSAMDYPVVGMKLALPSDKKVLDPEVDAATQIAMKEE